MADEKRPVLDQINLVVRDMDGMVEFYERLGVEIGDMEPPWDRHHRTASMPGGVDLDLDSEAFAAAWNAGWPGGVGVMVGFRIASRDGVDRTYEDLTGAGYTGQQPPYDAFWGARFAIVQDPDGNSVGLMSPADPDLRSDPPEPPA